MFRDWVCFATSTTLLAVEAQEVIALRLAKLAKGDGAAAQEAQLMVHEKFVALGEAIATAAVGGTPRSVVSLYREKVQANRTRLAT